MVKRKKRGGKRKERKKTKNKSKIEFFTFDFLDCEEKSWDSGAIFNIRIARFLTYKSFASLHCVYLGGAPNQYLKYWTLL